MYPELLETKATLPRCVLRKTARRGAFRVISYENSSLCVLTNDCQRRIDVIRFARESIRTARNVESAPSDTTRRAQSTIPGRDVVRRAISYGAVALKIPIS